MNQRAINCFITGRVQGVGFRMATSKKSESLGITGWVRNLDDGRVEVYACGNKAMFGEFRKWLGHGPGMAKVINVECAAADYSETKDFSIR